jgi:uncharacterized LabA/DUF88 family protein
LLFWGNRLRVRVYVDGFNLYYRALQKSEFKWLDLQRLSRELLSESDDIDLIRYFTADVSPRAGDESAPTRQQAYLRALRTLAGIDIQKGSFLPRPILRPLVGQEKSRVLVHNTEEKGSDVNLATSLLSDAFQGRFEAALILSQDTDLIAPLKIVKHELGLIVGLGWFEQNQPGKKHRQVSDFIRHISPAMLKRSQFPDPVIGRGGTKICKPVEWSSDA